MRIGVVVGDVQGRYGVAFVGATREALVFSAFAREGRVQLACNVTTGECVDVPAGFVADVSPAPEVTAGGVRVATRPFRGKTEVCRFHADGWVERAFEVSEGARLVATDTRLLAFEVRNGRLMMRLLGAAGPVVDMRLPTWMLADAEELPRGLVFSVDAALPARVLVFAAGQRAAWLTFEQLEGLPVHAGELAPPVPMQSTAVELYAILPGTLGDGQVIVRKGASEPGFMKRTLCVEDRAGKSFDARTFMTGPIEEGARFRLRDVGSPFPILADLGGGESVRLEHLSPRPGGGLRAPHFPPVEARAEPWWTSGSRGRSLVTGDVLARLARLAELGIAPLEGSVLDEAITDAFRGSHMAPRLAAEAAAQVLHAHWLAYPPPEGRARLDAGAIDFAVDANAAADGPRRWALVSTDDKGTLVVALDPAEREAIEREGVLLFDALPEKLSPPRDLASAIADLAARIAEVPADLRVEEGGRITLSLAAASALLRKLEDAPKRVVPPRLRFRGAGATHPGGHPHNEDAFGFLDRDGVALAVVADGVGGQSSGIEAAKLVVQTARELLASTTDVDGLLSVPVRALDEANRELCRWAGVDLNWSSRVAAAVCALFRADRLAIAHVGDCRAYLVRAGSIEALTKDHTLEGMAESKPLQGVLTRAVGMQDTLGAEVRVIDLVPGDALVFASDGLWRTFAPEEIARAVAEHGLGAPAWWIDQAKEGGPRPAADNVTAVVVQVGEGHV